MIKRIITAVIMLAVILSCVFWLRMYSLIITDLLIMAFAIVGGYEMYKSLKKKSINKAIKELYLNKVNGKVPEDVFEDLNSSFLLDKSTKQKELSKVENDLSNLKEKELNSKFIKEQKEKIINHFKDFKELNYDIVNSFIDYIEIGEKDKKANSQDVVIHWNF